MPIVREDDGLAMSSRNRYLDAEQREQAGALSAALLAGRYARGQRRGGGPRRGARACSTRCPAIEVDYLEVRGPWSGARARVQGPGRILIAARVGSTRLLDNIAVDLGPAASAGGAYVGSADHHELPWRN